ncbi:MAG: histidine kinase dimerization/phosphoacceptor domain-containing protein [Actinomycetota bacterium]|nr:histidine kinase dimerization/phosphoacceptor domain-containing protein [Actinomycetota bacterium]
MQGSRTANIATDAALGVGLCLLFVAECLFIPESEQRVPEAVVLTLGLAVSVAVNRRYPMAALLVAAGGTALLIQLDIPSLSYFLATMSMSFLAGRRMSRPRLAILTFVGLAAFGLVLTLVLSVTRGRFDAQIMQWFWMVLGLVFLLVFPWFGGRFLRQRAELAESGWERVEQLEREQRIVAERERLRERTRIAQDMHDSLGHELTLIALRAGGLEVARDLDEHHRRAVGELRVMAGGATEALRHIIGVLRAADDDIPMRPADDSISDLVDRARASGMAVSLHVDGDADLSRSSSGPRTGSCRSP